MSSVGDKSSSRKRSHWDGAGHAAKREAKDASSTVVSDQDALKALLSSAEARQQEQEQRSQTHAATKSQKMKKPRWDTRQQPQQRQQQQASTSARRDGDAASFRRHRHRHRDVPGGDDDDRGHYGPSHRCVDKIEDDFDDATPRDKHDSVTKDSNAATQEPQHKPDFGLSGALAKDDQSGNVYKGVVLKFQEPPEARCPNTQWRLYVFKKDELLQTLHVAKQSAYLLGRNTDICDVPLEHPSCSSQHAVLQYRALPSKETGRLSCRPYLMDLESTNGSFINGVRIDAARYYELRKGDVLKFGASSREYVLLTANTTSVGQS